MWFYFSILLGISISDPQSALEIGGKDSTMRTRLRLVCVKRCSDIQWWSCQSVLPKKTEPHCGGPITAHSQEFHYTCGLVKDTFHFFPSQVGEFFILPPDQLLKHIFQLGEWRADSSIFHQNAMNAMMIARLHTLPTKPCAKCAGSSRSCEGKLPATGSTGSKGSIFVGDGVRDMNTFWYEHRLVFWYEHNEHISISQPKWGKTDWTWLINVNYSILMMCPTTDGLFREGILLHSAFLQTLHSRPKVTSRLSKESPNWVSHGKLWMWNSGKAWGEITLEGGGGLVLLPQTIFWASYICLPWLKSLIYGVDGLPENRSSFALEVAPLVDSWNSLILHIWDQWTSESPWTPCEFWCKQQTTRVLNGFEPYLKLKVPSWQLLWPVVRPTWLGNGHFPAHPDHWDQRWNHRTAPWPGKSHRARVPWIDLSILLDLSCFFFPFLQRVICSVPNWLHPESTLFFLFCFFFCANWRYVDHDLELRLYVVDGEAGPTGRFFSGSDWILVKIDDLQVETTIFTKFCKIKPNNEFGDFKAPWKWEHEALRIWISQNLSDLVKRSINLPFLHGCLVRERSPPNLS